MEKPTIHFQGYRIESIEFKSYAKEEFETLELDHGNLEVWIGFTEDYKRSELKLKATVLDPELLRSIVAGVTGYFEINVEQEKAEIYMRQNGVAILFPYLRSIISMVSSLDNENTVVLPTINTTKF